MKPVFDLLGARADEEVIHHCVQKNSFEQTSGRPRGSEESASFFRKGVAGDWRAQFTPQDRKVYEQVAGQTLLEMGYSLD